MTIVIKKYGRWDETCNWQLESKKEKQMTSEQFNDSIKFAGFSYSKRYNEWHVVSEDKLGMTVISVKQ